MMNCETFRDRAFGFLRGTMREDCAAFESHRASCPTCADALRGIQWNDRILSAARVPTAPAELWPRIAAAIAGEPVVPFWRARIAAFLATAAAVLVVCALFATGSPATAPRLNLVIQEVGPDSQRTFRALMPRYEDVDAATAMVDTFFRSDY
jgi:hypothetical protein